MHYHCEILLPPAFEGKEAGAVETILAPFDEDQEDRSDAFWDWYEIGGRWSGCHVTDGLDRDQLKAFYDWTKKVKITVSAVQCGKQTLSPSDQRDKVDAKWREMFPGTFNECPLFDHSGQGDTNVCRVSALTDLHRAERVIVAGTGWDGSDFSWAVPVAASMFSQDIWNGVQHQDTTWDGGLLTAIEVHNREREGRKLEHVRSLVDDLWLAVTVDLHS